MLVQLVILLHCAGHYVVVWAFPGRLSLNGNQGRAPTTATTGQSGWQAGGTASILEAASLMETSSRWSFSPTTWQTSRKQRRTTCWCTNVSVCFLNQNIFGAFQRDWLDYFLGEEYIKSLTANPELVDRLALSSDDKVGVPTVVTLYRCPGRRTLKRNPTRIHPAFLCRSRSFSLFFLRMTSPAIRCCSRSTSPCQRSKRELRTAPSSRAPSGPAGTTIWRPQSLSTEKGRMAQRCVRLLSSGKER